MTCFDQYVVKSTHRDGYVIDGGSRGALEVHTHHNKIKTLLLQSFKFVCSTESTVRISRLFVIHEQVDMS